MSFSKLPHVTLVHGPPPRNVSWEVLRVPSPFTP